MFMISEVCYSLRLQQQSSMFPTSRSVIFYPIHDPICVGKIWKLLSNSGVMHYVLVVMIIRSLNPFETAKLSKPHISNPILKT